MLFRSEVYIYGSIIIIININLSSPPSPLPSPSPFSPSCSYFTCFIVQGRVKTRQAKIARRAAFKAMLLSLPSGSPFNSLSVFFSSHSLLPFSSHFLSLTPPSFFVFLNRRRESQSKARKSAKNSSRDRRYRGASVRETQRVAKA